MSNPKNRHEGGGPQGSEPPQPGKNPATGDHSHEQHQQGEHGPTRGQGHNAGQGHHEPGKGGKKTDSHQ
jgi:hypothetical protein